MQFDVKIFLFPCYCFVIVAEQSFLFFKLLGMYNPPFVCFVYSQFCMQHFMVNNELNKVLRYGNSVKNRVNSYEVVIWIITAKNSAVDLCFIAPPSPGYRGFKTITKVLMVQCAIYVKKIVVSALTSKRYCLL